MPIPKVSAEALQEAQTVLGKISEEEDGEVIKELMNNYALDFKKRQPEFFNMLEDIFAFHMQMTEGIVTIQQLSAYFMVMVNAMYIQAEIDECTKIFNFDEDEFKKELDDDSPEEPYDDEEESPEDWLW